MQSKSAKAKNVSFSTTLSAQAKEALARFCLKRGLKINSFLEEIIWDRLEEEMDLEIANSTSYDDLIDIKEMKKRA